MSSPTIRAALPGDEAIVASYNAALASETEGKALDAETLRRGVTRALADPDRLRYWLAELDGKVVGQAAVTREWSDWRDGWVWWFQSVYVAPEARGSGVFRALYRAIHQAARSEPDVIGLRLYVEAENHRAQATYAALGMRDAHYRVYEELWPERLDSPPSSNARSIHPQ